MGVELLRRRISWRHGQCTAEDSSTEFYHFSWSRLNYFYDDEIKDMAEDPDAGWDLYCNGVPEKQFSSEVFLKCYIIRFIYGVSDWHLIPSELLYDAGLLYANNEWIDRWAQLGTLELEFRKPLPEKPSIRSIRLPGLATKRIIQAPGYRTREKVKEEHRTRPRLLEHFAKKSRPTRDPVRLQKGDDLSLTPQEEYEVRLGDYCGAGLDVFDPFEDDECFYVLEVGGCDEETCAAVTIDPETPEGEEGAAQVQAASPAEGTSSGKPPGHDYFRFG